MSQLVEPKVELGSFGLVVECCIPEPTHLLIDVNSTLIDMTLIYRNSQHDFLAQVHDMYAYKTNYVNYDTIGYGNGRNYYRHVDTNWSVQQIYFIQRQLGLKTLVSFHPKVLFYFSCVRPN